MFYSANILLSPSTGLGPVPPFDALIYEPIQDSYCFKLDIRISNYYIYKVAASQLSSANDHYDLHHTAQLRYTPYIITMSLQLTYNITTVQVLCVCPSRLAHHLHVISPSFLLRVEATVLCIL